MGDPVLGKIMLTPSSLQAQLTGLAVPVLAHPHAARSADLAETAAQRARAQVVLLLGTFTALPTNAVWFNGAEIYHDTDEAGSTASTASNGQVLSAFGLTIVI